MASQSSWHNTGQFEDPNMTIGSVAAFKLFVAAVL
jgi:hypothetical protein